MQWVVAMWDSAGTCAWRQPQGTLSMKNQPKEILPADLWWLEQRRSFQGQVREDGRHIFSQCLCNYTKGTGTDTPGCSCFLPRIPACSYLLRTVTDSYFGGKAVAILRLQTKICMKNMEVFWLFTHVFQASYVLFPQLKFTMYIRDSQKWGRESQEWYFIKGELVFQLHIYLYLFISTARRRCCLDPPWPGRP